MRRRPPLRLQQRSPPTRDNPAASARLPLAAGYAPSPAIRILFLLLMTCYQRKKRQALNNAAAYLIALTSENPTHCQPDGTI